MEPLFIDRDTPGAPRRFAVLHQPSTPPVGLVVYAPPFAEEMNKARRMAALQARAFCSAGWVVLQLDLLGCGDSDGDLADASWAAWLDDIAAATAMLRQRSGSVDLPLWLWGLRGGCLLATEAAHRIAGVTGLLLWQPVASGSQLLTQFLRLKSAAAMLGGGDGESADVLRQQLLNDAAATVVLVAGYPLSAALAQGLNGAKLAPPAPDVRVEWFEVQAGATLSPAAEMTVSRWQDAGCQVSARVVEGPAFWQTVEIETAPKLLTASIEALHAPRPALVPA